VSDPLYLDHAATTPPLPEAMEAFRKAAAEAWANPGSLHGAGAVAARLLETSRRELREAFGARKYRVIWTATGTEANHLGIQGMARTQRKARRVLVGAVEHPSSLQAAEALASEGYTVEELPVDSGGIVRPEVLDERLGPDVALVSVHWVNNELGTVNPIAELVAATRGAAPEPLDLLGADTLAVAAHKIGGLRGCAALLLREGAAEPAPLFVGGGHEGGLRSGTENVMGIAAFVAAAQVRAQMLADDPRCLLDRRAALLHRLKGVAPELVVLGSDRESEIQGAVLSIAVPGIRAETFLHMMEAEGVYIGSGSACHTHGAKESRVLAAIDLAPELRDCVLRLSLSGTETEADFKRTTAAFEKAAVQFAR
jgi:cysteine desulfurase